MINLRWMASSSLFLLLLLEGAFPCVAHADQITDLCAAAKAGDLATATRLVQANPDLVFSGNVINETALLYAAEYGQYAIVSLLLDHGANPDTAYQWTYIRGITNEFCGDETPLQAAAERNHASTVALLLARGASKDVTDWNGDQTALGMAVQHSNLEVIRLLLAHHADVNAGRRPPLGDLPCDANTEAIVAALVAAGADVNARFPDGDTPLINAEIDANSRENKAADVLLALLKHGADPNLPSRDGQTPLRKTRDDDDPVRMRTLIAWGARDTHAYLYSPMHYLPIVESDGVALAPVRPFAEWVGATITDLGNGAVTLTFRERSATFSAGSNHATIDGLPVLLPVPAELRHTSSYYGFHLYVPLRALAQAWRAPLDWDEAGQEMTMGHPTTGETLTFALSDPSEATVGGGAPAVGAFPVIVGDVLLGGMLNGAPVDGDVMKAHLQDGQRYRLYREDQYLGTATATFPKPPPIKEEEQEPPSDNPNGIIIQTGILQGVTPYGEPPFRVEWTPDPEESSMITAVAGGWNPVPHGISGVTSSINVMSPYTITRTFTYTITTLDGKPYVPPPVDPDVVLARAALGSVLKAHGLYVETPNISVHIHADIDGDGQQEFLIAGTSYNTDNSDQGHTTMKADTYSVVMIQEGEGSAAHNVLLAGYFNGATDTPDRTSVLHTK